MSSSKLFLFETPVPTPSPPPKRIATESVPGFQTKGGGRIKRPTTKARIALRLQRPRRTEGQGDRKNAVTPTARKLKRDDKEIVSTQSVRTKPFNKQQERDRIIRLYAQARGEKSYLRRLYEHEGDIVMISLRNLWGVISGVSHKWCTFSVDDIDAAFFNEGGRVHDDKGIELVRFDTSERLPFEAKILMALEMDSEQRSGSSVLLAEMEAEAERWCTQSVQFRSEDGMNCEVLKPVLDDKLAASGEKISPDFYDILSRRRSNVLAWK